MIVSLFSVFDIALSQVKDYKEIQLDIRSPIRVYGTDEDEVYFYAPQCVKYNKYDNNVYVADTFNDRIVVLDSDLKYIRNFGKSGQGPGEFNHNWYLDFHNDLIIVKDHGNFRIQVLDNNGIFLSGFKYSRFVISFCVDSQKKIYMVSEYNDKSLISVYDFNGKKIYEFGELLEIKLKKYRNLEKKDPLLDKEVKTVTNALVLTSDNEDNIYCAFRFNPVFRKYDKLLNLIYEKNIDFLPEIISNLEKYKKAFSEKKSNAPVELYMRLIFDISVDDKYLYLSFDKDTICMFDKDTGEFVKRIKIQFNLSENTRIRGFDASSEKYIYALEKETMLLLKIAK
jgi:hypothetical protein